MYELDFGATGYDTYEDPILDFLSKFESVPLHTNSQNAETPEKVFNPDAELARELEVIFAEERNDVFLLDDRCLEKYVMDDADFHCDQTRSTRPISENEDKKRNVLSQIKSMPLIEININQNCKMCHLNNRSSDDDDNMLHEDTIKEDDTQNGSTCHHTSKVNDNDNDDCGSHRNTTEENSNDKEWHGDALENGYIENENQDDSDNDAFTYHENINVENNHQNEENNTERHIICHRFIEVNGNDEWQEDSIEDNENHDYCITSDVSHDNAFMWHESLIEESSSENGGTSEPEVDSQDVIMWTENTSSNSSTDDNILCTQNRNVHIHDGDRITHETTNFNNTDENGNPLLHDVLPVQNDNCNITQTLNLDNSDTSENEEECPQCQPNTNMNLDDILAEADSHFSSRDKMTREESLMDFFNDCFPDLSTFLASTEMRSFTESPENCSDSTYHEDSERENEVNLNSPMEHSCSFEQNFTPDSCSPNSCSSDMFHSKPFSEENNTPERSPQYQRSQTCLHKLKVNVLEKPRLKRSLMRRRHTKYQMSKSRKKQHKCRSTIIGVKCFSKSSFKQHRLRYSVGKRYKCEFCCKPFIYLNNFTKHVLLHK